MTRQQRHRFNYITYILGGFIVLNIVWYLAFIFLDIKALPSPFDVYSSYSTAIENSILTHSLASIRRIAISLGISLLIAVTLGLWVGYKQKINRLLGPMVYFSYPIPKLALLPIIMVLFDIGETSKIIVVVLIVVFQLIITIRDAVINIPHEHYHVLTSFGASSLQKMKYITIPAILPELLSALRVALGIITSALFFIETFGTDEGLGYYITDAQNKVNYIQMYFGIIVLSLIGFVLFLIIDLIDSVVCAWKNNS